MLLLRSRGFDRLGVSQYQIERSLRFNDDDSAYLNRTFGSSSGRTQWTFSCWFKSSGKSGAAGTVDSNIFSAGTDGSNYFFFVLRGDGTIRIADVLGGSFSWSLITTAVYRDPTAWYNFVIQYDSTQGTASDRVKLYVNGTQVTSFSSASYPSASYESWINSTATHYIGRRAGSPGATEYADGYLTEVNHISGSTPVFSSFGETNATTGAWNPIEYTGSYGTNGFYLKFADNSGTTSTTLGKDSSGNGNNWTPNNFSVTAGAGNDSLTDTPTNYGTGTDTGGVIRGNYCVWDMVWPSTSTLSNGNLDAAGVAVGTFALTSGKWYWETTANVLADGGLINSAGTEYTTAIALGVTRGFRYDVSTTTLESTINGSTWATISSSVAGTPFPYVKTASTTTNFGQRAYAYTVPSGYTSVNTQNLAAGSITTSGTFTGNASADGPVVPLNGIPTTMTINGNAVTFGTHADKLAIGFKLRTSSASYNTSGSNSYSVSATSSKFKYARAQANP